MTSLYTSRPDPWLAVAGSFLAPGLGQAYAGRARRGLAWFGAAAAGIGGFLWWILHPVRSDPLEGAAWFALLTLAEVGSWADAYRVARVGRRPRPVGPWPRPAQALAWSILCPGLGHAYLYARRWPARIALAPLLCLPALFVLTVSSVDAPPAEGWPVWLAGWPTWATVPAGMLLTAGLPAHAWIAAWRRRGKRPRPPRVTRGLAAVAVAAWLAGALPVEAWLKARVRSFRIPSSSMVPTLEVGDRLWARRTTDPARGDVVIFHPPDVPDADYVKRVIALPGERVEIREGTVLIDGVPLEEPYAVFSGPPRGRFFGPLVVPADRLFVMGDNRDGSRDSRSFGTVSREALFGRATKLFWPRQRAGPIR